MKKLFFLVILLTPNLFVSQYLNLWSASTTWNDFDKNQEDRPIEVVVVPVEDSDNIQEPVRINTDQFNEKIKLIPGLYDIMVYYINSDDNDVCLISGMPLDNSRITLPCSHSFNYVPLVNDIISYFNVEISEELEDSVMTSETEVIADFEEFEVNWEATQVNSQENMKSLGNWAYLKDNH